MRFAYFGFPHTGGTHSVYRQLRAGFSPAGIDVRWLAAGEDAHRALADPTFAAERQDGTLVGWPGQSESEQARSLVEHIGEGAYDGLFVNIFADRVQMSLARYLPRELRRIMIVHTITPATYSAARSIRDHVHATATVSRRIRDDLVGRFGFDPAFTRVINNAVERCGEPIARDPRRDGLRLLFLGRIHDESKGVLWLPRILDRLPDRVTLTVAGAGPDLARLKAACSHLGPRVRFLGRVASEEVPALAASHDILIAPSRYEGFMITLIEAMREGCVPVASRIRGVTDTIVDHDRTGLLFRIGDVEGAAAEIRRLLLDPALLAALSAAGPGVVRGAFSLERMVSEYLGLIESTRSAPNLPAPLPLNDWRLPSALRPSLRTYMPVPVKNLLRNMRERLRA